MKKIIFTLALCLTASSAFAWPPRIVTYSPRGYVASPIKILAEWMVAGFGSNVRSTVTYTHNKGCLQVIVTNWAGPFVTGQTTTEFCP